MVEWALFFVFVSPLYGFCMVKFGACFAIHSMWRPSCVCVWGVWIMAHYVTSTWFTNHQSQNGENFQQNHDPFCCLRRLPLRLGNGSVESWKSGSQTLNVWYVSPTFTIQIGQIQVSIPVPLSIWGWIEDARPSQKCDCHLFGKTHLFGESMNLTPFWKDSDEPSKVGLESKWSVLRSHPGWHPNTSWVFRVCFGSPNTFWGALRVENVHIVRSLTTHRSLLWLKLLMPIISNCESPSKHQQDSPPLKYLLLGPSSVFFLTQVTCFT